MKDFTRKAEGLLSVSYTHLFYPPLPLVFLRREFFMNTIQTVFGINVFNDTVMRERLPKETYKQLQRTIKEGKHLDNRCV